MTEHPIDLDVTDTIDQTLYLDRDAIVWLTWGTIDGGHGTRKLGVLHDDLKDVVHVDLWSQLEEMLAKYAGALGHEKDGAGRR